MSARRYVALYRNVNLGQRTSPTRPQFIAALTAAGARDVQSFLTNGTFIYKADSLAQARAIPLSAAPQLQALTGLTEPAYVRTLTHLRKLVQADPFAGQEVEGVYECCFTSMLPGLGARVRARLPLRSARGDCEVFVVVGDDALALTREVNGKAGYPTKLIESVFGVPVTTRAWNTIVRLVNRSRETG